MSIIDQTFLSNIAAGAFVWLVDVILVVVILGWFLRCREERKWRKTRQGLAYVLLTGMNRVMQNFGSMLVKKDGKVVLNKDIGLHLLRLELALSNFNEQTIVHLPSLLPPLTEKLSDLTVKISGLEEVVIALKYHIARMGTSINTYDPGDPGAGRIDPAKFYRGEDDRLHLAADANKSDDHYLVLTVVQISERTRDLSTTIEGFVNSYANNWVDLDANLKTKATAKQEFLERGTEMAKSDEKLVENDGFYLVLYTPTAEDLGDSSES